MGLFSVSCSQDFLSERPNSNILAPTRIADFQRLLDNFEILGVSSALPHLAADEYYINSESNWLSSRSAIERNSYIWDEDIYGGEVDIKDWNTLYETIFYTNSIIKELDKIKEIEGLQGEGADIYGQALFYRARAYYDLVKNFSAPFDKMTENEDLGVPLRIDPSIDYTEKRASVSECYERIFSDIENSLRYLSHIGPLRERNRATKLAAFAQLSRIYLYRREYDKAEQYADSVLHRYDRLVDYNTLSLEATSPFNFTHDELILYGATGTYNNAGNLNRSGAVFVDTVLIDMYDFNDLRLHIYFINNEGGYTVKRGYNGTGLTPFTGLAIDEVLLNKVECLVRRGQINDAAILMDKLLLNRYRKGTYIKTVFKDKESALQQVLIERRKELVWRCLRWDDIKRLNKEGASIVLKRNLGDKEYILEPNSPRYVFNIPQDEINRSGIVQNER